MGCRPGPRLLPLPVISQQNRSSLIHGDFASYIFGAQSHQFIPAQKYWHLGTNPRGAGQYKEQAKAASSQSRPAHVRGLFRVFAPSKQLTLV